MNEPKKDLRDLSEILRIYMELILAYRIPCYLSYTRRLLTQEETTKLIHIYMHNKRSEYNFLRRKKLLREKWKLGKQAKIHYEKMRMFWTQMNDPTFPITDQIAKPASKETTKHAFNSMQKETTLTTNIAKRGKKKISKQNKKFEGSPTNPDPIFSL